MEAKRIVVAGAAVMLLSGCGILMPSEGVILAATPEGMEAFGDMQNALVTNGKASPDKTTAAWRLRTHQETQETIRDTSPGILSGLFATPQKQRPNDGAIEGS